MLFLSFIVYNIHSPGQRVHHDCFGVQVTFQPVVIVVGGIVFRVLVSPAPASTRSKGYSSSVFT